MAPRQQNVYLAGNFLICSNGFFRRWASYLIRESRGNCSHLKLLPYLLSRLKLVAVYFIQAPKQSTFFQLSASCIVSYFFGAIAKVFGLLIVGSRTLVK